MKTRRSARAYHADASTIAPTAPPAQPAYPQQPQPGPPQHPYANAPPPFPLQAQPLHYPPEHSANAQTTRDDSLGSSPRIPQPPHSAGQKLQGPRSRIDPNQIPSPVAVQQLDQQRFDAEDFLTCSRGAVPQSCTDFVAVDQGNANPRFLRLTTYGVPNSDDLACAAQLPLGLVVQPFAPLKPEEGGAVPIVDFGESGPPRCQHCRGYINPFCSFIEGGQKWVCNLCGGATAVDPAYFSHLDSSGHRQDVHERAELMRGSVDFRVPKEYWAQDPLPSAAAIASGEAVAPARDAPIPTREPRPAPYVFAIDVSWQSAASSHVVKDICAGLREVLYGAGEAGEGETAPRAGLLPPGSQVAIVTFDSTVHFYNLSPALEQAQMLVVGDLDDMFIPLHSGLLVDPVESRHVIESLLDALPDMFAQTSTIEAALGGAIKAAHALLRKTGGQAALFQASLPTIGPGALRHREDTKLYGTDKERTLFMPGDVFYRQIAEECAEAGIGLDLFLFPSQYIDVASIGVLAGLTGGELFFHPRFSPVRDGSKLRSEIRGIVERETGYSATMRIRCSNGASVQLRRADTAGLRVTDHFGNFYQRNVTDLEFGTIDADKAIGALIKHDAKLDPKADAYIQAAILYTSASGDRRVRVHNLAVPVVTKLADVFRLADMDTTMALVAKEAITQTLSRTLREVRDAITDQCVKVLLSYRKHCASATSPGQLILPESYKLYPVFALALLKTKALKGGPVASDVRTYYMRVIKSIGVGPMTELLYPRMYPVHVFAPEDGFPKPNGRLQLPRQMRTSYARMEPDGAYLIENGQTVRPLS